MMALRSTLSLTPTERGELDTQLRRRTLTASVAQRIRIVLLLADGVTYSDIQEQLNVPASTISRWKKRYQEQGLVGLATVHPGQAPRLLTAALRAKILNKIKEAPPDGSTHWSVRKMAKVLKVGKDLVHKVFKELDLRPHRLDRYKASDDPDFEQKATDIIGLYLNPPQHAAVFCVHEKTAIQALDRTDRRLPLSPGRAERHGFEYRRHGTLSLYAAFNTNTGKVLGKTAASHTSEEFVWFLGDVVDSCPHKQEIHIILDNLSAHKTAKVKHFLEQHPTVQLHFTPTYASWLNQVEIWFSKLQRDVIIRGIFTSVEDLSKKILRYIRLYDKVAKPFKWKYNDVTKRIRKH